MGIEYAPNKFEVSVQVKADYEKKYGVEPLLNLVDLYQEDVTEMESLDPATHAFSYNPTWKDDKLMTPLGKVINRSTLRVLVWCKNPAQTRACSVKNATLVKQIQCTNVGGEKHTFYFYHIGQTAAAVTV